MLTNQTKQDRMQFFEKILFFKATDNTPPPRKKIT